MKLKFLFLFVVLTTSVFLHAENINIKGFGEIPVVKDGDNYKITLGNFGEFSFQGSLVPLELNSAVTIDQLNKLPGFKVLSKLGLKDVGLAISNEGLIMSAKADTKSNIDKICKLFKITTPYINLSAAISPGAVELEGKLEFSDGAVELLKIDKTGTCVKFSGAQISTTLEPGSAELSVTSELLIKPTEFDPELESIYTFSYDIVSQTLTGSGSMMSEWSNPLGTSKFLKQNSIVVSNAAIELGINVLTLVPVNLGLAIEKGKLFTLDFGVAVSIDPVNQSVGFWGKRDKMNANDFTTFLREGFGLSIPNVLPDIYYVENPEVKFAPNGCFVGEVEFDKGIALHGMVKVGDAIEGPMDFYFDMENEFLLHMDLDYNYKKFVMNELHKVPGLNKVADKVLNTFQVRYLYIDMSGNKEDMQMTGEGKCMFEVFGNSHEVSFAASLDPQQIANSIINKLKEEAPGFVAAIEKVGQGVQEASNLAKSAIGPTANIAAKYIKLGATKSQHTHLFDGGEKYCRSTCIPNRANDLANRVLPTTKKAIQLFHDRIIDDLIVIEGGSYPQTKKLREDLFLSEWNNVVKSIDDQWNAIREDKEYVGYFVAQKWAENGGNQFRGIIDERKKEYTNLKDKLYNNLIDARLASDSKCVVIENRFKGTTIKIDGGAVVANKVSSNKLSNWIVEEIYGTYYVRFRNRENGTYLHIENGKLEATDMGIGAYSAMWELEPAEDGFVRIKNRWKPNLYLHQEWQILECATIKMGWHSAMWNLSQVPYETQVPYESKAWNTNGDKSWKQNDVVLVSNNKKYKLVFQVDGNLVLYKYGIIPLWSSNTYNKEATDFKFQKDGNLVVYNSKGVLWSPNCYGKGGQTLYLQDDGNIVNHAPGAKVIWSTNSVDFTVKNNTLLILKNRHKDGLINIETGPVHSNNIGGGSWSAQWTIEPAEGNFVHIKNRWKGTFLNIEGGGPTLQCTEILPGWHSAQWEIILVEGNKVKIRNRWKADYYIHHEWDVVECATIQPGWMSAQWEINYVE